MNNKQVKPEWTAKYWQWIFGEKESPLKTGLVNIDNEVIMLPCTGGGAACDRKVQLKGEDTKKDILVPVFAAAEYGKGEYFLREKARALSTPISTEMSVDGVSKEYDYVEASFKVGKYDAVSAGYWYRLSPLSPGKHLVRFGGNAENGFYTKVMYQIEVDD